MHQRGRTWAFCLAKTLAMSPIDTKTPKRSLAFRMAGLMVGLELLGICSARRITLRTTSAAVAVRSTRSWAWAIRLRVFGFEMTVSWSEGKSGQVVGETEYGN